MSEHYTPSDQELVDFVYHEARLLDEKRYEEWEALFTEDGVYWIPLEHDQRDPDHHTSLVYDDRLLMQVRLGRMKSPRAFSCGRRCAVTICSPDPGSSAATRRPASTSCARTSTTRRPRATMCCATRRRPITTSAPTARGFACA
ncbi:MAG: aromatic-ring-hydroxylating dioxygenase subunit beta [Arhodomonas sp.]|nr:aromatic-ring-hydroxylating dioxygenase subunit beta [Arhodomonas sp.]